MDQFAYLLGDLMLFAVWLLLFLRKPYRREMIVMSLYFTPFTLFDWWFLQDYWSPQTFLGTRFGFESFFWTFVAGGIAAVVYEEVRNKTLVRTKRAPGWMQVGLVVLFLLNFFVLREFVGVNSMYALYIVFLITTVFILLSRKDLFADVVGSGLLCGFLGLFFYLVYIAIFPGIVQAWWKLENLSGVLVLGIPLEELLFAFGFGMVAGPLYEVWQGYRLAKR